MSNLLKSIILIGLLLGICVTYTIHRTNTYITAEFKDLAPFNNSAPIYYNGCLFYATSSTFKMSTFNKQSALQLILHFLLCL